MRVERDSELPPDALDEIPPDVIAAVEAGRTVEAVKLLREHTGLGLRDAKRVVDMLERVYGGGVPDAPQFTEVGGSRGLIIIVAALVAGYLAFRFLGSS